MIPIEMIPREMDALPLQLGGPLPSASDGGPLTTAALFFPYTKKRGFILNNSNYSEDSIAD